MKNYGYALIVVLFVGSVLFADGEESKVNELEGTANWYDWGRVRDWGKRQVGNLYQNIPYASYPGLGVSAYALGSFVNDFLYHPIHDSVKRATDYLKNLPIEEQLTIANRDLREAFAKNPQLKENILEGIKNNDHSAIKILKDAQKMATDALTFVFGGPYIGGPVSNLPSNWNQLIPFDYSKEYAQYLACIKCIAGLLAAGVAAAAIPYAYNYGYNWYKNRVNQQKIAERENGAK